MIELRFYVKKLGIYSIDGEFMGFSNPGPVLQYQYKEQCPVGVFESVTSEWQDVPIVYEEE